MYLKDYNTIVCKYVLIDYELYVLLMIIEYFTGSRLW
jgi:hypothetical protein